MTFHFIHIGKTGGSAIKRAIKKHIRTSPSVKYVLHGHDVSFVDVIHSDPDSKLFFVVRDPVSRFVSGFNSRLRRGRPLHDNPWTPGEAEAFARFSTANALAEGLAGTAPDAAEQAINEIYHTARALSFWLISPSFLEENRHRIAFVASQEFLSTDFDKLRIAIELPATVTMPSDERARHATPEGYERTLSATGEGAIRKWYGPDYPILEWCHNFRRQRLAELG